MNDMKKLALEDRRHLDAAEGWLGLGNSREANEELEQISASFKAHPEVLELRYKIYSDTKRWDLAVEVGRTVRDLLPNEPWGHFYTAYALHELNHTQEAYDTLRSVVDKFPEEQIMRYNLACYCCRLGRTPEAREWLLTAMKMPGKKDIRELALDDKDLEPLWSEIKEM